VIVFDPANGGNAGIKDVQAGRSQFAGSPRLSESARTRRECASASAHG
jgi:hypothetical protein